MFEIMDEIMELTHQITSYMIEIAKLEVAGKKVEFKQIENNKILKILFERLQDNYRNLESMLLQKSPEQLTESMGSYLVNDDYDEKYELNSVKSQSISELEEYLETSYMELRYISINKEDGETIKESIYENQEFEALREEEYYLQESNIEDLDLRLILEEKSSNKLSFQEKAYILIDMTKKEYFSTFAFKQMNRYINDLNKKRENIDPKTYEETRKKYIEQKYILYYEYLNDKYNGILQKSDEGRCGLIKNYIDKGAPEIILKMTEFEISENIKRNMIEYKDDLKKKIKSVTKQENIKGKKQEKQQKQEKFNEER